MEWLRSSLKIVPKDVCRSIFRLALFHVFRVEHSLPDCLSCIVACMPQVAALQVEGVLAFPQSPLTL